MACLLSAREKSRQNNKRPTASTLPRAPATLCRAEGHAHSWRGLVAPRGAFVGLLMVSDFCRAPPAWGPSGHPTPPLSADPPRVGMGEV